jgi:hypothetical protein
MKMNFKELQALKKGTLIRHQGNALEFCAIEKPFPKWHYLLCKKNTSDGEIYQHIDIPTRPDVLKTWEGLEIEMIE